MQKLSHTAAHHDEDSSAQDFVAWAMVAMWSAAAVFLLATFQPF